MFLAGTQLSNIVTGLLIIAPRRTKSFFFIVRRLKTAWPVLREPETGNSKRREQWQRTTQTRSFFWENIYDHLIEPNKVYVDLTCFLDGSYWKSQKLKKKREDKIRTDSVILLWLAYRLADLNSFKERTWWIISLNCNTLDLRGWLFYLPHPHLKILGCKTQHVSRLIVITSGLEDMLLPNTRWPNHGGITISSGTDEMPVRRSTILSHVCISTIPGV
jgi:hypothetical protein